MEEAVRPFARNMTRAVFILIAVKAALQIKRRAVTQSRVPQLDKPRSHRKADRAIFGSRLRQLAKVRDFKNGDPRAKIALLLTLLREIDVHAARLAKRLANGLSRRRGGVVREQGHVPFCEQKGYVSLALMLADTS